MLHPVNFENWKHTAWCVPTTISILTGAPVGHMHVRAAFIQNIALKKVERVFLDEAVLMLREQGYRAIPINLTNRYTEAPTLRHFLKDRTSYEKVMPLMICIAWETGSHMLAAHMGMVSDTKTSGKAVPSGSYKWIGKHVIYASVVSPITG